MPIHIWAGLALADAGLFYAAYQIFDRRNQAQSALEGCMYALLFGILLVVAVALLITLAIGPGLSAVYGAAGG